MDLIEFYKSFNRQDDIKIGPLLLESHQEKFSQFLKMYYAKSSNSFDYRVDEICKKLGIEDRLKKKFLDIGEVRVQMICPKCHESNVWVKTKSRSNVNFSPECKTCFHKLEDRNCSCLICYNEEMEKEKLKFVNSIPDLAVAALKLNGDFALSSYYLDDYIIVFEKIHAHYELNKKGRINLYEMEEIASYGLCPTKFEKTEAFETLISYAENSDAMELIERNPAHFLLWIMNDPINQSKLDSFIGSLIEKFEGGEFSPKEIDKYFGGDITIIKSFVIEFGNRMGIDLTDISDLTLDNLVRLLDIMPLGKALYAIKGAIKAAYSYGREQNAYQKMVRNFCISNLNKLHTRYTVDGWDIPKYEVEDWKLEEEYKISSNKNKLLNKILNILDSEVDSVIKTIQISDTLKETEL